MSGQSEEHMDALYSDYQTAIKAGQVEDALTLGTLYYNVLRGGKLTAEDREQLQKDLLLCAAKLDTVRNEAQSF